MKKIKHIGSYGLIIKDDKIVLIRKVGGPYDGKLDLPGGTIEFNEMPEEALIRELKEEVGIKVTGYELFDGNSVNVNCIYKGEKQLIHHIGFFYKINSYENDLLKEINIDNINDDSLGAEYYDINKLYKEELSDIAILETEKLGYNIKDKKEINMLEEIKFDEDYINECKKNIDIKLIEYIENNIMPKYDLNDKGHNKNHIEFVLKRALEISKNYDIDHNILYTCVSLHDIACHINREKHETLSAEIAYNDKFLKQYFSSENLKIIKEAIEDHRASNSSIPRNIYGKILSSSDRKISIEDYFISSLFFQAPDINKVDMNEAINNSYNHAIDKFGKNGYATSKFYVEDDRYKKFLNDLQSLIDNKQEFYKIAKTVFNRMKSGYYD